MIRNGKYYFLIILLILSSCIKNTKPQTNKEISNNKHYKVLYISSYHEDWEWPQDQLEGFKDVLQNHRIEYKTFYMNTKRNSSEKAKTTAGRKARDIIKNWNPDLVYTTDDNAQMYVTKYYINSKIPFIFSGVNGEPEDYGFENANNIAGILERELSIETIKLLLSLAPNIKKIAVISDTDITWPPIMNRMKKVIKREKFDLDFIYWDIVDTYMEYKDRILIYNKTVDAIIHLGDFAYKDQGRNVPFQELEKWTIKNSNLPDASFWEDRIRNGYLAAVTISGYEQGRGAGRAAKKILFGNIKPSVLGYKEGRKGQPVINLKRAKDLNIKIPSDLLLSAKIFNNYEWNN